MNKQTALNNPRTAWMLGVLTAKQYRRKMRAVDRTVRIERRECVLDCASEEHSIRGRQDEII